MTDERAPVGEAQASAESPDAIRDTIVRACRRGLADAVDALLGEAAGEVCAALSSWRLASGRPFPRLAGMCWAALGPLRVAAPDEPAAVQAERLLVGTPLDADDATAVAGRLRAAAGPAPGPQPLAGGDDVLATLSRRALGRAIEDFWTAMADVAAHMRDELLADDRIRAEAVLAGGRLGLAPIAERIEILASRVTGAVPVPADRRDAVEVPPHLRDDADAWAGAWVVGAAAHATPVAAVDDGPTDEFPTGPLPAGDATRPFPRIAPPPTSRAALGREVDHVPQPVRRILPPPRSKDVEYREVPDRRYAPFVFLLLALCAAAWVLLATLAHTPAGG
jgi:hypothetical protein